MWWAVEGSNLGPLACEASALTTELTARRPRCAALDYFRRPAAASYSEGGNSVGGGNDWTRTSDLALMKRPL